MHSSMTVPTQVRRMNDESAIRVSIEARARAIRARDVDALVAFYAPDVKTFDLVTPLASDGIEALRCRVTEWFSSFTSPIEYRVRKIELFVAGDVAFEHHLVHVEGWNKLGRHIRMWFRESVGYKKMDGVWRVVHQHSSVPMDMETGMAQTDLHPDRHAHRPPADAHLGLPEPTEAELDLITVASFSDLPEAELAKERLENAGMHAFVLHEKTAGVLPFLNPTGIQVQVIGAEAPRARELLGS
jgi:ketosteroid isomerase-like protein